MINLLPENVKEDMLYGRKNRQIINWLVTTLFGIVILLIVAAVGRLTIQTAHDQTLVQKQNMEEQLKIANFDEIDEQYGEYVDGLTSVEKLYAQQVLYTRLIRKLGTLLPTGARLTNIALSDKDRAIGLNFDNDADGLGPLIQTNLTDQGKQVSDKTRLLFAQNLRVPLTGKALEGETAPEVTIDSEKQSIIFNVHSPSTSFDDRLATATRSGGDMAFIVMYDALDANKNLEDYKILNSSNDSTLTGATQPQIRNYEVRNNLKAVDFNVAANSLEEAKQLEETLLRGTNSIFIEVYTFEDRDHANRNRCKDEISSSTVCEAVCKETATCTNFNRTCVSTTENGCQYTVRAYYDELYKSATVKKLSAEEVKQCDKQLTGLACTHQVTASYSQLFSRVDLNRVSACSRDVATGVSNCPVEMRAEFSDDAKFYLISLGGTL